MNTVLSQLHKKKNKSFQTLKTKEYTEQVIEEIISTMKEGQIESYYSKQDLLLLKAKIIIYRIKKMRNDSALKIQKMWNKYQTRLKVHKIAHHVRGCYTISPSIKNITKISIKIFTNEFNKNEFKILPLRFCPIRKSFVIDIPKNKFYTQKKILKFNFIRKDSSIFYDENYKKIFYFDEYVHEIDFSLYDKNQKILDETIYNFQKLKPLILSSKDSNYLSTEDEKENSENSTLTPDKFEKNERKFYFTETRDEENGEDEDEYAGLRSIKRRTTVEPKKNLVFKRTKRFESFDVTYSCKSKLKSILKCSNVDELHKRKLNHISSKKVSFGETVYLY